MSKPANLFLLTLKICLDQVCCDQDFASAFQEHLMKPIHRRAVCMGTAFIVLLSISLPRSSSAQDSPAQAAEGAPPPAQSPAQSHRARIGLALSGGGALGLAEIGVIQWMEENHIPVDRVAGTSMGSIIASMYATGMSPAEIRQFAEKIDWDETFLPAPGYSQLSYRRKQDRR